ncbi:replicative DNA helicase (TIGR00665) [uncultured Mediterranean phage uvMED]|nr:replicative DNA helicase (TIGR00665) [uncultured Mediterranean phage uvMED]
MMDRSLQEQIVLGSMICDPSVCDSVASILKPSHFKTKRHQEIYSTAQALRVRGEHVDAHSILSTMLTEEDKTLVDYVFSLDVKGDPYNWEMYANRVLNAHRLDAMSTALTAAKVCVDVASLDYPEEAQNRVMALVNAATATQGKSGSSYTAFEAASAAIEQFRRAFEGESLGLECGIPSVDEALGGFKENELYIVAGRPGMGKTTFAMNVAEEVAKTKTVLFISLEMGKHQVGSKLISQLARLDTKGLRRGKADPQTIERAVHAANSSKDLKLKFIQQANITVEGIAARARQEIAAGGELGMVVVDYLQLMTTDDNETRAVEVGKVSRGLKLLAIELGIPVIALAQLNRKVEQRENKRPFMSDLRDSGSIEQDADVIMFLYRESEYTPSADPTEAELILAKFRMETKGTIKLRFCGEESRFKEYHETYAPYRREAM